MPYWQLTGAKIDAEDFSQLTVRSGRRGLWMLLVLACLPLLLSLTLLIIGILGQITGLIVFSILIFSFSVLMLITGNVSVEAHAEVTPRTVTLRRKYLGGSRPWAKPLVVIAGASRAELQRVPLTGAQRVMLYAQTGDIIVADFGQRADDATRFLGFLQQKLGFNAGELVQPKTQVEVDTATHIAMLGEIRSWGWWQLGLGALHLFTAGFLNAPWGVVLVLVGLASFYFREASMFVIYATTMVWAGLSNLLSGQSQWVVGGLFQFYLAFQILRSFQRFRQTELNRASPTIIDVDQAASGHAGRVFPWLALVFGLVAISWPFGFFVAVVLTGMVGPQPTLGLVLGQTELFAINLAVLGIGLGSASLLSKYRYWLASAVGLILSALTLLIELALILLLRQ